MTRRCSVAAIAMPIAPAMRSLRNTTPSLLRSLSEIDVRPHGRAELYSEADPTLIDADPSGRIAIVPFTRKGTSSEMC